MRTHNSVRRAAVVLRTVAETNQLLVAYIVPAEGYAVVESELRRHLKTRLPDYMIPSAFVVMDALPMTPNGKLDQRALPAFDATRSRSPQSYVAPRNELEETLVEIWAEVLKIERIGVLDDFFELGGHSLLVAQVVARVRKYIGIEIPVRSMFEEPTVAGLAADLARVRAEGAPPSATILPRRSVRQTREQVEARLRELSDEEIDALLIAALANRTQGQFTG